MNPLHQKLTHDLDKISMMRRIFTQRAATKDGIYLGQLPAMRYIAMNPGCTQKDVAEFIQVSPPSIAVMVKRMVRDGVVQKKADEKDLRQNRLYITDKGMELAQHCHQMFNRMDEQVYAGFSEEELTLLSSFLTRLIDNLASDEVRNVSNLALLRMMKELDDLDNKKKEE